MCRTIDLKPIQGLKKEKCAGPVRFMLDPALKVKVIIDLFGLVIIIRLLQS